MKLINKLLYLSLMLFLLISCTSKDENLNLTDVSGIYEGTLSSYVLDNSSDKSIDGIGSLATAEITKINDKIQVYVYNETFEATKMLDMFTDGDDVKVCATGNDFEMMYGKKSDGGMNGGMSGGMSGKTTKWMQHLSTDHNQIDKHSGGFDMDSDSFEFTFILDGMEITFKGKKQ